MATSHVILGAGPAGLAAAQTIRALAPGDRVRLVCDEPAYSRMVLPYYLAGDIGERALATADPAFWEQLGVEARLGVRAGAVDPGAREISLDDGSTLGWDRLLVATGSRVARPSIEGVDDEGVIPMWTLAHANAFLAGARGETVIVGAGFIAFTVLDAVAKRSARVRFVEIEDQILPRMLDRAAAELLEARLAEQGIEVRKGARVEAIETAGGRRRLQLAGGESVEGDAVILATGVQPNVEFLEGSGVEVGHGVLVDAHQRASVAGIYAAGDVAEGPDLLGGTRRVQAIQPTAVDHGRVAGANMAGQEVAYSGSLTMNILAAQGLEACSFGRWDADADTTVVSNPANRIYRKYVWDGDVMVGAVLVGPNLAVSGVNDAGMLKGLVQTGVALGPWKTWLADNPLDLRRAYVASGAAKRLLDSTLLAGRASAGGGFRFPALPARRRRSPHHATIVGGAPGAGA